MFLKQKKEIEILSTKAVSKFLTTIKAMLLTKKQEQELFRKIAKGDKKAVSKLVNANLFLVESIAKRYEDNNHYLSYKTLVEIGKSGLRKAVDKYNPDKDYKFSTYATWWIRQAIHLALGIKDE